jgi:hypothetical protein
MQPYAELTRRLSTIPGVERVVAWTMVAELGPAMSVFPDADHAVSWCGMCPGNCVTGGRRKGGRTRKANPYLRRALCQAAWAASHTKDTYLSALYRRWRARMGRQQAVIAVGHQILRVAYTMLRRSEDYRELGGDYYDRRHKPRVVLRLVQRLLPLGYEVQLQPAREPRSMADQPLPPMPLSTVATLAGTDSRRGRGRPGKCNERGDSLLP